MRYWLVFFAMQTAGLAITPDQLGALKRQFPQHVAGPMSESTNPEIALLYFRYKDNVAKMRPDAIEAQFEAMRQELLLDLRRNELDRYASAPPSQASQQNETWLRTKVRPWLMKLESLIVAK